MVINVTTGANNQTVDCGCGCAGGTGNAPPPIPGVPQNPGIPYMCYPLPGGDPNNEVPPVPDIEPPPAEVDTARCRLANYFWWLVLNHMTTLRSYVSGLENATNIVLGLLAILPAAWIARIGSAALLAIAHALVTLRGYIELGQLLFDPAIDYWVENREEIVCRIYNSTGQSQLSDWVWARMLAAFTVVWDDANTDSWVRDLLSFLWRQTFLRESLFGLALNGIVPDTWLGDNTIDCSLCIPTPPEAGLWAFDRVYVGDGNETFANIPNDDGFTLAGEWTAGTATDVRVRIQRVDTEVLSTWSAVTFNISVTGSGGNVGYGAENNQSVLVNLDDNGGINPTLVAIVRSGYPTPAGQWAEVISVPNQNWLAPYILIGRFGFHPPLMVIDAMSVQDWQFYEDAPI